MWLFLEMPSWLLGPAAAASAAASGGGAAFSNIPLHDASSAAQLIIRDRLAKPSPLNPARQQVALYKHPTMKVDNLNAHM